MKSTREKLEQTVAGRWQHYLALCRKQSAESIMAHPMPRDYWDKKLSVALSEYIEAIALLERYKRLISSTK